MSIELYSNLNPKLAKHFDERLSTVQNLADLPDPTILTNFIYEGAIAYVGGTVKGHYKATFLPGSSVLTWNPFDVSKLVMGNLNIVPGTTVLDLSLVSPSIEKCYAVTVDVIGGVSADIQSITNFPTSEGKQLTFYVKPGKELKIKHRDYDVASPNQIVLEVGFDMVLKGRQIGNESLTLMEHQGVLCQWDATQFMKPSEWAQNMLSIVVADNLTTQDPQIALSANQGHILNEKIELKQNKLIAGKKIELLPQPGGEVLINSIPRSCLVTKPSFSVVITGDTLDWLVAQNLPLSLEYRYYDLRSKSRGFWMLPPEKANNSSNWILIDEFTRTTELVQFKYYADPSIQPSQIIDGNYFFKLRSDTKSGDPITTVYSSGATTNNKRGLQLTAGLYTVDINVDVIVNHVSGVSTEGFLGQVFFSSGIPADNNPAVGATSSKFVPMAGWRNGAGENYYSFNTTFMMNIITPGNNDSFSFCIRQGGDYSSLSVLDSSTLRITKFK